MLRQLLAGRTRDPPRPRSIRGATSRSSATRSTASSGPRPPTGIDGRTIQLGTGRSRVDRRALRAGLPRCSASTPSRRADPARLRPDASEVLVLQSDPSLARELLGWEAADDARGRPRGARSSGSAPARARRGRSCPALTAHRVCRRPTIPLAEPSIGGNAARYLEECLATNFVSSVGPFVERFETEFAALVGSRLRGRLRQRHGGDPSRALGSSTSGRATRSSSRR